MPRPHIPVFIQGRSRLEAVMLRQGTVKTRRLKVCYTIRLRRLCDAGGVQAHPTKLASRADATLARFTAADTDVEPLLPARTGVDDLFGSHARLCQKGLSRLAFGVPKPRLLISDVNS